MIKSIKVTSTDELIEKLNTYKNNYVYRGHANAAWRLQSTLERILGKGQTPEKAQEIENYSLFLFKSKYHIYKSGEHIPAKKLAWLSVMQHYGVPTRLIDFSTSPYVALYFALETYDRKSGDDLAIYAIDYTAVMDASQSVIRRFDRQFRIEPNDITGKQDKIFESTIDKYLCDIVWVTEPFELNARIDRQAGTFLISGNLNKSTEEILNDTHYDNCDIVKIIIPGEFYSAIFGILRKINMSAKSIYGDLGGLAKQIKMELQVYGE